MTLATAYLCDHYGAEGSLQIAEPIFRSFGGNQCFSGVITTLKCFEDNAKIKSILTEAGKDRILVIDGGGSHRCALIDGDITEQAHRAGWQGLVVYGCIRNVDVLRQIPIGILALHTHPLACHDKHSGDKDALVTFAGINFRTNYFLYADNDGMVVSETMLS